MYISKIKLGNDVYDIKAVAGGTNTTYKFTIGTDTKGDSTNGVDLGTLKSETAAASGTTLSLVTTGEKAEWNAKTSNVGTVTGVTVGTGGTNYTPSNGIVTIPAYPTTLPASDVSSWAKANTKPSYTLDEVSDGTTRKLTDATQSAAGLMPAADKKKVDNVMNLTNSATTTGSLELAPNTLYSLGALTGALTVTLGSLVSGVPNTYMMEFDINDDAATPTKVPNFPATIVWKEEPVWTTGKHYEISIRYSANTQAYYAMFVEFDTAS